MKISERSFSAEQENILKKMFGEIAKPEIKTVSFRMKDVLVVTPFSSVYDMFVLMEEDFRKVSTSGKSFVQLRLDAQDTARKKSGNISLENIYSILSKTGKVRNPEILIQRECELIKKFSTARTCGKLLYNEAVRQKKKIIIVTEHIYPENIITEILEKCGYNGYPLVISEDFGEIQEKSGTEPSGLLHIGGNVVHDVEAPILKGSKALLLSPEIPLMVKSGRLRGFVQAQRLLEIDSPEYLALRCAFGLYAMYGFDVPQNKIPKSDFCNDPYMLGFIVFGTLSLIEDYRPETSFQREILSSLENNNKIIKGADDFKELYRKYFGEYDMKFSGCNLPLVFLENHSAPADRILLRSFISDGTYKNWSKNVTDPEILPVYARTVKKNAVSKIADKLFPVGTKVRTIADGILAKSHR
ncbi:MAG: hypothetical protein K2L10_05750 [Ruminococcus sp.]|nr:hypothetical protein [Ruminococcus sp.]